MVWLYASTALADVISLYAAHSLSPDQHAGPACWLAHPACVFWVKVGAVFLGTETGLLVNYYGLPSVSLRDVWFHKFARNEPGFRQRDIMCNMNHPNLLGHQCASPACF